MLVSVCVYQNDVALIFDKQIFRRSITRDTIPEENFDNSLRRPSWFAQSRLTPRASISRQQTLGRTLIGNVSTPSTSPSESSADEDVDCLMKAGF
jgi:hypothetical protein